MRTYPLKAEQVPEFLNGATTLRIPVRPQPKWEEQPELWNGAWCGRYRYLRRTNENDNDVASDTDRVVCPYPVGSELALTETWGMGWLDPFMPATVCYKADNCLAGMQWRPAITMPAAFSRFKRLVTDVNVEHREIWEWVLALEEYLEREDK